MSKTIEVKLNRDPQEVVAKFKATAEKNGVHMAGDHQGGEFHGKGIEGRYAIVGDALTITLLKKPIFLSWSLMETKVREYFS